MRVFFRPRKKNSKKDLCFKSFSNVLTIVKIIKWIVIDRQYYIIELFD